MKKKVKSRPVHHDAPIHWLPVDSRLITPLFRFGAVKGIARIFLEIEITLTILVVIGTLFAAGIKIVEAVMK